MSVTVTMPALGESVTEGTVTRWLKAVGDTVVADEPLLEVSTDKVDTEIPAPASGVLLAISAERNIGERRVRSLRRVLFGILAILFGSRTLTGPPACTLERDERWLVVNYFEVPTVGAVIAAWTFSFTGQAPRLSINRVP